MMYSVRAVKAVQGYVGILALTILMACSSRIEAPQLRSGQAPEIDVAVFERQIHDRVNRERRRGGQPALTWHGRLNPVARAHSRDMASRNFFSHINPDGANPTMRGAAVEVECRTESETGVTFGIGENIYMGHLYSSIKRRVQNGEMTETYEWRTQDELAEQVVLAWMGSPGHRRNILSEHFDSEAIGVFVTRDGRFFVTQNFCKGG